MSGCRNEEAAREFFSERKAISDADAAFFREASAKVMHALGSEDGKRFFGLIAETAQDCYAYGWEDAGGEYHERSYK